MPDASSPLLQIGQTGQLSGQGYQVAGWMVMSMEEDGVTYCWNEFHLLAPDGTSALLVQEDGEHGPEWRMFRLIEPPPPITAAEAETKRVGDTIVLTGQKLRVTCVDESRVIRVAGQVPEGVEEGDIARYFNAESGNLMIVVSWTGEEVEVFRGVQLPGHAVYRAFGLKPPPLKLQPAENDYPDKSSVLKWVIIAAVIGLVSFGALANRWPSWGPSATPAPKIPKPELPVGATGSIDGSLYRVAARATVEIGRVGARHARQEYHLVDEANPSAAPLLVQGTEKSGAEWLWLRPVPADVPLPPRQAATYGLGATVSIGHESMRVTDLFLSRVQNVEGATTAQPGTQLYGLEAQGNGRRAIIRWDENTLMTYRVTPATKNEIKALLRK